MSRTYTDWYFGSIKDLQAMHQVTPLTLFRCVPGGTTINRGGSDNTPKVSLDMIHPQYHSRTAISHR